MLHPDHPDTSGRGYSVLCLALNNAEDGSLRLARRVKIDEKNRLASDLKYKTSFSLIFIQDLGNDWAETIGQRIR